MHFTNEFLAWLNASRPEEAKKLREMLNLMPNDSGPKDPKLELRTPLEVCDHSSCVCSLLNANNVDEYYRNLIDLIQIVNKELVPYGVALSSKLIEQHLRAPKASKEAIGKQFVKDPDGNALGRIYETTAKAFVDIVKFIVSEPVTTAARKALFAQRLKRAFKVLIRGACQSGKQCIISMLFYTLPALIYVATDQQVKIVPILNLVQYTSLQSHVRKEMLGFRALYGDLVVESGECSISINDYIDLQKRDGSFLSDEEQQEKCVVIRSARGRKMVKQTLSLLVQKGYTPVVFTDECHYGSEKGGGQDRLLSVISDAGIPDDVAQIGISATADEVLSRNVASEWHFIDLPLCKGYVGPQSYNGFKLPASADYIEILPVNMEINQWMAENGISFTPAFSRKAYLKPEGFCAVKYGLPPKKATTFYHQNADAIDSMHLQYRKNFEAAMLSMFRRLFQRTRSITIRAFNDNRHTLALMTALNAHKSADDNFVLAPFFKDQSRANKSANVKEYLAGFPDQQVVLFVTADARMGCAFPASNNVFIDLTESASYTSTIIQGVYGRACGYHKIYNGNVPLVLLSSIGNDTIESLKRNNWKWAWGSKDPGPRTKIDTEEENNPRQQIARSKRKALNYLLVLDLTNPIAAKISTLVNMAWKSANRLHRTDLVKKDREDTLKWNSLLKQTVFTREFLTQTIYELDPSLRCLRFLVPGEIDPMTGKLYDVTTSAQDKFKGVVGMRTTLGYGTTSRNTRRNAGNIIEPQVAIEFMPGIKCTICGTSCTSTKLYSFKDDYCKDKKSDGGHWPKEALNSCCWQSAEIMCVAIHLRIAAFVTDHEAYSDFIAKPESRYLIEDDSEDAKDEQS